VRTSARTRWLWIAGAALSLLAAGCAAEAPAASEGEAAELTVSAAASLTNALEEIEAAFEGEYPAVNVVYNFGASGALQRQIEQGAPVDLFLSAAAEPMEALVEQRLVDPNRVASLLTNELVVIVPSGGGSGGIAAVGSLADLASENVRNVAIGIPDSVPAGGYAREALTASGLWDALEPKLVQAKDVRQVLQYVETGNADAGFVYRTDAMTSDGVDIAVVVDPALHEPISYPAGIVSGTKHAAAAETFLTYLQSEAAAAVFAKYGFSVWEPS